MECQVDLRVKQFGEKMGTVSKALGLLDFLGQSHTPKGLTDLARLAGFDKATTRRLLLELVANGFVEQDVQTRDYALGPALQMLGRAREERFPLLRISQPIVSALAEKTGETVHTTEFCAGILMSVCIEHSPKTVRVSLEPGQKLPLHSTASGFAFLAASAPSFVEGVVRKPMHRFTARTPTDRESLFRCVSETSARGYSISNETMEEGVHSVAAALCDPMGKPVGTIAVAMPIARASAALTKDFGLLALQAAEDISLRLFGKRTGTGLKKAS
jgi:IclR family transcriptional regulator, acetate operon repressor